MDQANQIMPQRTHAEIKRRMALLSILSNSVLILFKVVVGIATGSVSVISEAIHSGMDLVAAVMAWGAVREAHRPPDKEHPYGHGKWENLSAVAEALLIAVAAAIIIKEAIEKLRHGVTLETAGWGVAVMAFSAAVNWAISAKLIRVARQTDSAALLADAMHLRTDVWTSLGVMAGLAVIGVGRKLMPGADLDWLDPLAAMLVALLIFKAAWVLTKDGIQALLDQKLPDDEEEAISKILQDCPAVVSFHRLRTRKAGALRFADVHIRVDENMTVRTAHALSHDLTRTIQAQLPESTVTIHIEPARKTEPSPPSEPPGKEGCSTA